MKIIGTSGSKTFKIIPREYVTGQVNIKLRDDSSNEVTTISASASTVRNYMTFDADFGTLKEGRFYNMDVLLFGTSTVIYKDKVFCTNQTINQSNNDYYSVNDGEYVQEDSFDNDYIII